jgi:hypothetical protein
MRGFLVSSHAESGTRASNAASKKYKRVQHISLYGGINREFVDFFTGRIL